MVQRREPLGLIVLILVFASVSHAQEEVVSGDELVVYRCTECHTLNRVFRAHYDSAGWAEAIPRMEEQGLYVEDEERAAIIAFLATQRDKHSLLQMLGMQHFLLLHFPVVLLLMMALFEGLALWRREGGLAGGHAHLVMRLTALMGTLAIAFGFALIFEREMLAPGMILHRNLGIATGALLLAALVCRELAVKRGAEGLVWGYRGALLAAVIAMGLTADRGGVLVHGDFIAEMLGLVVG